MNLIETEKKKIFLVEDEQDLRISYLARLQIMGFTVHWAGDGPDALAAIKKNPPDLVLLDMIIPRFNGFKVCALLKEDERTKHIPIIVISALNEPVFRRKAIDCGADAFFVKPFDWGQLKMKIDSLLKLT